MADGRLTILGPVEMWAGFRQVPLGTPKQQGLIAALAITPGRPVALDTLAYRLWGEEKPNEVNNNIRTYVARLRSALRHGFVGGVELIRKADSYVLDIDAQRVDLWRARALTEQAGAAVGAGDDGTAVCLYRRALRMWSPDPLCGLRGTWAERTRTGLGQERLATLTRYFAAELRLGEHERLIGPLFTEVSERPLDESLASQLMLSLYRSHRHADALAVFHRIRSELDTQIGVVPGPGLRRLYTDLLRNDPRLDAQPVAT
jgi:DNA-binding SARP family transcriptional activator